MWAIGYGFEHVLYQENEAGGLNAGGVCVTDRDGWIDVPSPPPAMDCGAPAITALRVGVVSDAHGGALLYVTEAVVGERFYRGPDAGDKYRRDFGCAPSLLELLAEIDRRIAATGADAHSDGDGWDEPCEPMNDAQSDASLASRTLAAMSRGQVPISRHRGPPN